MDDRPGPENSASPVESHDERGDRSVPSAIVKRVRTLAFVVIAVLLVAVVLDVGTATPALCGSCHEMAPRAQSWSESAHAGVSCVACHQPPRPWYALPARLADRWWLLGRDVVIHLSGDYPQAVDGPPPGSAPLADTVCLQCHDPNRKATSGFRILIDHAEHAKLNGSCVSCHVRTAHPVETRGGTLTLMAQCFTCHGTEPTAQAPGECGVCHPADYKLLPTTHEDEEWGREHGALAVSDELLCDMCHSRSFCQDCHRIEMPHPAGWAKGTTGHAVTAERDRAVCGRCHGDRPDMCTMCHHEAYDPTKGTWVSQHPLEVTRRGTAFCMSCHEPTACVRCHSRVVAD